jgi:hypothetical protein
MRYKVPQNIDLEDRVIGPLTLKQFIYLLAGGMVDYILYKSLDNWFGWFLIISVSAIALAFAFAKIQEQDFSYFLSSLTAFLSKPKIYTWNKEIILEKIPKVAPLAKESDDQLTKDPQQIRSRLRVLADIVDNQGWQGREKTMGNRVVSEQESDQILEEAEERKEGIEDPLEEVDPTKK